MKQGFGLFVILSFCLVAAQSEITYGATISGTVKYSGKIRKRKQVKVTADAGCVKANGGKKKIPSDKIVMGSGGELANVFVYIKKGVKKGSAKPPTNKVVLDQKGCRYAPHVMGVGVNQPIEILNSDALLHNVHSMAKKNKKQNFNMGMAVKGQKSVKSFKKPEIMIKIKCDVHGWMTSYVGVVDHPFFAVTDASGKYTINNVPPGDYTLEVWHEKYKTREQKVTVSASGSTADFLYGKKL